MNKIINILILLLTLSQFCHAESNKYKILFLSNDSIKIGPYGNMKEYHAKDTVILSERDAVFFSNPEQMMRIALLGASRPQVFNVYAPDYIDSHSTSLRKYIQKKQGISKDITNPVPEKIIYFVNDTVFFPGIDRGASFQKDESDVTVTLPFDETYGSYVTEGYFSGEGPFIVRIFSSDGNQVDFLRLAKPMDK